MRIEAAPDLEAIRADEHRLHQAFRNILENAIAASAGPAAITVAVDHVQDGGQLWQRMVINDAGHGMDAETVARIFEPFHTTKQSGTGLGMAICKRIIDAHGGKIRAESERNRGSTITVILPSSH